MNTDTFIQKLLSTAKTRGILEAEVYLSSGDRFQAMCQQGAVSNYTVNSTRGLSLRGIYNGRMGYAATEAMDDDAIDMLISSVMESALLTEDDSFQQIYKGDEHYPEVNSYNPALDQVDEKQKLDFLLSLEPMAKAKDPRIIQLAYNAFASTSGQVRIVNTHGLDLQDRENIAYAYASAVAKDGDKVATGDGLTIGRDFSQLSARQLVDDAVEEALFMLTAEPIPSGTYRALVLNKCMPDLLSVFSGVFSAENAQKGMSLLSGKEGEMIASPIVTLLDDPLMEGGLGSSSFDAEGVACRKKAVVENGKFITLLHNLKTAHKAGVQSTGNASRAGYAGPVRVSTTNFYFQPGQHTLEEMLQNVGNGLVITGVSGLHAGANPISGDFSLIAQGYTVKDGKKDKAVDRITVAGNFFQLLKNIRDIGCDLIFPGDSTGSPTVDIGEIAVAGK